MTAKLATAFSTQERRAALSIASVFAVRMLGLFMVLPVLALYAQQLKGATPSLMGVAMGCYGLTQAICQFPFGLLSDRFPRKRIIAIGIIIFILGSIVAAISTGIWGLILGRALQGAGAIGSVTSALLADLTRESQRTKAMAILGITIGGAFASALMLGPLLSAWLDVPGLFWLSAGLGGIGMAILYRYVPNPDVVAVTAQRQVATAYLALTLRNKALMTLNLGIFVLHAILIACFTVLPLLLKQELGLAATQQWQIYLPTLLLGVVCMLPLLRLSQHLRYQYQLMLVAIAALGIGLCLLWWQHSHWLTLSIALVIFFAAFNFLEAHLPATISKLAPAESRGTAMGIFSSCQFLGIFFGGILAGWLSGYQQATTVLLFCAMLAGIWFALVYSVSAKLAQTHPKVLNA